MGVGWWGRNGDIAQEAVSDRLRVLQVRLCCTNQNIELGLLEHLKGGRAVIVLEHGLVVVSDGKLGQSVDLEGVVGARMADIVTHGRDQQRQHIEMAEILGGILRNVQRVTSVSLCGAASSSSNNGNSNSNSSSKR